MDIEVHPFDLRECVESAMDLVGPLAAEKHLDIAYLFEGEVPAAIGGDVTRLRQILLNLLSNAVKFTPAGGRITLSAKGLDGVVEISVTDTGVGIDPAEQALVFEEFRQAGGDYLRKSEGTGLGLSLAKRFVELHGGTIRLDSRPGVGSTFSFTLPERLLEAAA